MYLLRPTPTILASACLFLRTTFAYPVLRADQEGGFDDKQVDMIRANAQNVSTASWELGTLAEALTELSWPSITVFSPHAVPPPERLTAVNNASDVIRIAQSVVASKPPDSLPLVAGDGAVGDPASIGNAVLYANWTRLDLNDSSFSDAAWGQLTYLRDQAPRSDTGAISHRADQVSLWADFVYMAPPFMAYFGALQGGADGQGMLQDAYDQCRLYRDALFDANASLWRHVALGDWEDPSHWGTGNGWAAAGMLRVLETIKKSDASSSMYGQQHNLTIWINEILNGTWANQKPNGTLFNTLDDPASFADTSSTALLASVTFRMAALTNNTSHIDAAYRALSLVRGSVDQWGWLQGTVDPITFSTPTQPGGSSPEGQSFVLLLQSAWSQYVTAQVVHSKSNSTSTSTASASASAASTGATSTIRSSRI
ncbi:hypothetical protein DENSPDRAFT_830706 [Dentipellis sp. KUC8613]|nr:hypothetical protein DENSPDRAFT_830706 [Dentipellis sp. KUC8613]